MELKEVRSKIDAIDDQIADLYVQRMQLAVDVAKSKSEAGLPVENSDREREIIARVTKNMPDDIKLFGKQVFGTMFDTSKAYQYSHIVNDSPVKLNIEGALAGGIKPFPLSASVACQGIPGAYSQMAADKIFPIASASCFRTWDAVFSAVEKGFCEYGILPIENSTAGSVIGVYDLMHRHNFYIVRSVKLKIKHYLLARKGATLESIKEVVSHDQAISQCAGFINGLGDVKITRCDNTAAAAKLVAESGRDDIACISSKECADIYGLQVLKAGVNDHNNNYTRFIAISKKLQVFEGANKISITVNLAHETGSLNKLLNKFSTLGLNLTKLESRPMPDSPFEFAFYFDFDANVSSVDVQNLLADIELNSDNFTLLGAYEEIQ